MASQTTSIQTSNTVPWNHQELALEFIQDKSGAMLAMEMGTGKTLCAVRHANQIGAMKILILCPLSIVDHVWPDQIEAHSQVQMTIVPLGVKVKSAGAKKTLAEQKVLLAQARREPVAVIVNYESAYRKPLGDWLMDQHWDLLIMDESHRIKSAAGTASMWVSRLSDRVRRKLALTGTPMPHSPLDVYAQFRAIDKHIYGFRYQEFKTKYAIINEINVPGEIDPKTGERKIKKVPKIDGYKNIEELKEKFYSLAFRVEAKDVLDLPPVIESYTRVHLSPKAQKLYDEMEETLTAELESGETILAANALSRLIRFQQLTSGFAATTDGRTIEVDDSKANALSDIIEDLPNNEPIVVFARFTHDLQVIKQTALKHNRNAYEISGETKELDEWKADAGGVLAVQIQAGGLGLDLTKARYCVYYSLGFSLGDYLQSIARLHRPGQASMVDYIHLVAAGTIDQIITGALQHKEDVVTAVLAQFEMKTKARAKPKARKNQPALAEPAQDHE